MIEGMKTTARLTKGEIMVGLPKKDRIEGHWVTHEAAKEIEAENARLRKALEGVLPYVRVPHDNEVCGCDDCNEVRSAIAAAREAMKL